MRETTGNYCHRCGKNTMRIIENDDGSMNGVCHNCGNQMHTPAKVQPQEQRKQVDIQEIFGYINQYAFLIGFVAIIISILTMSAIGGVSDYANSRFNILQNDINDEHILIENLTTNLNTTKNEVSEHSTKIANTQNNVANIQNQITNLNDLESKVDTLETTMDGVNNTVDNILDNVSALAMRSIIQNNSNFSLHVKEYQNQSNVSSTRYVHFTASIDNTKNLLNRTQFCFAMPDTTIKVMSYDSEYTPIINGDNTNHVFLDFFEQNTEIEATFNISWDTSDYNTYQLDANNNLESKAYVNGFYFDFDITKETIP